MIAHDVVSVAETDRAKFWFDYVLGRSRLCNQEWVVSACTRGGPINGYRIRNTEYAPITVRIALYSGDSFKPQP